jgi:hypothetical protein
MFGKSGVNAPRPQARPAPSPAPVAQAAPVSASQPVESFSGRDNLNHLDFGRQFKDRRYTNGNSMLIAFMLWLVFGAVGGHRFYLGQKMTGMAILGLGILATVILLTSGLALLTNPEELRSASIAALVSGFGLSTIHFVWVLLDFAYIGIRRMIAAQL